MKKKRLFSIGAIILIAAVLMINFFHQDTWDVNADQLKQEVLSIESTKEEVLLSDVIPFEWDIVYSFDPYTPKEIIYDTVGYKWDSISETVNGGMNQLVFMNDNKVVCYVYGYPANIGYGIFFTDEKNSVDTFYATLTPEDDLTFQVIRSDDVVTLTNND